MGCPPGEASLGLSPFPRCAGRATVDRPHRRGKRPHAALRDPWPPGAQLKTRSHRARIQSIGGLAEGLEAAGAVWYDSRSYCYFNVVGPTLISELPETLTMPLCIASITRGVCAMGMCSWSFTNFLSPDIEKTVPWWRLSEISQQPHNPPSQAPGVGSCRNPLTPVALNRTPKPQALLVFVN